jgi:hypothetical protein
MNRRAPKTSLRKPSSKHGKICTASIPVGHSRPGFSLSPKIPPTILSKRKRPSHSQHSKTTKEIGLRKAVGIRKEYILWQFLSEAIVLTFFGGIMGVILGWLASLLVSEFAGLATVVAPSSIVLAFSVSAGVGIIFGFYPARRAANLIPMEALRYE